jgi:hypothetical protein
VISGSLARKKTTRFHWLLYWPSRLVVPPNHLLGRRQVLVRAYRIKADDCQGAFHTHRNR